MSVLSLLGTAHVLLYLLLSLCFRGWCRFLGSFLHHGYQLARWVLCPWLLICLSFLFLKFLLPLFDFHGVQQEGEALQVYLCRRHVTGLIHGAAAGADASCIYLESFSFSFLCTIEYTHTVLPNFHIVTLGWFSQSSDVRCISDR